MAAAATVSPVMPVPTMPSTRVIGGVDTHKHTHYAAVIYEAGRLIGHQQFPATDSGYAALLAWMRFKPVRDAGGRLHSDDPGLSAQARRRFVALAGLLQALLAMRER